MVWSEANGDYITFYYYLTIFLTEALEYWFDGNWLLYRLRWLNAVGTLAVSKYSKVSSVLY